jgi:hypothetical protein
MVWTSRVGLFAALVVAGAAQVPARQSAPVAPVRSPAELTQRDQFLAMFARGYFPGRTGQILIVPREGTILTRPEATARYMHGSPWPYDTRIPMLFWGAGVARHAVFNEEASQQDVAVTMASALGVAMPPSATGRVLPGVSRPATNPRLVFLLVLDGMRPDYLTRHAHLLPTLTRLWAEGASFPNAAVNYLPTNTGAGHATIASGAEPAVHGITGNNLYDRAARARHDMLDDWNPRDLAALTLSDVWQLHTGGKARIIAQGSSQPAGVALAGHGRCQAAGFPVTHAGYDETAGVWKTNPDCFFLPREIEAFDARRLFPADGLWRGHRVDTVSEIRRSALFSQYEADTFIRLIETQGIGTDDVTDLVQLNYKTADYVGHKHGPDSAELAATLGELDRNLNRMLAAIESRVGRDYLLVITGDHGMPTDPPPGGGRYFAPDIVRAMHLRFDTGGQLVTYYEPENSQIFVDQDRLAALGLSMTDLTAFLEAQPYVFAAYTEEEVRQAAVRLRRR